MQGGGSDAESSGSGGAARPIFRRTRNDGPLRTRRKSIRSKDDVIAAALQNLNDSSDEDAIPTARHAAALRNLSRKSESQASPAGQPRKAKTTKGGDAQAGNEGSDPKVKRGTKRSRVKMGGRFASSDEDEKQESKEPVTVEGTLAFLRSLETGQPTRKGKAVKTRLQKNKGGQTKVLQPDLEATPEKDDDDETPEKAARLRQRGGKGGGKGGGKARSKGPGDSDSEDGDHQPSEETEKAWAADLALRCEPKSDNVATAFSIKPCLPLQIRQLDASSFLGGKKPEEGGRLLFDSYKKVNVHFLLGTHRELMKLKERRRNGEQVSDDLSKADSYYLRWLVIQAVKLRVINKTELKRGQIDKKRVLEAQKSNKWSLGRTANLTAYSDDEGAEQEVTPELKFKGRQKSAELIKEEAKEVRKNLLAQVADRQSNISVSSSHNVDLAEMQDMLTAPSLSFDWEDRADDDDDDHLLEVDVPDEEKQTSKRDLFLEQLHRSASCNQARGLTRRTRSTLSLSTADCGGQSTQEELQQTQSATGKTTSTIDAASAGLGASSSQSHGVRPSGDSDKTTQEEPMSKLWEQLEAVEPSPLMEKLMAKKIAAVQELSQSDGTEACIATATPDIPGSSKPVVGSLLGQVAVPNLDANAPEAASSGSKSNEALAVGPPTLSEKTDEPAAVVTEVAKETGAAGLSKPCPDNHEPSMSEAEAPLCGQAPLDKFETAEGSGSSAEPQAGLGPPSPGWHGITPTQMWQTKLGSFDLTNGVTPEMGGMTKAADDAKDQQLEISPTMPMAPTKEGQLEISPTMPMVSDREQRMEISPTAPMVPSKEQQPEISPTMPMAPSKDQQPEISPTLPTASRKDEAMEEPARISQPAPFELSNMSDVEGSRKPLGSIENQYTGGEFVISDAKKAANALAQSTYQSSLTLKPSSDVDNQHSRNKRLRRSASVMSDDSLSDAQSEDLELGEEQQELLLQQDPKQRRREREWLRHKRLLARQEADESLARLRRRKLADSQELGASTMTAQERSRYESMVSADPVANLTGMELSKVPRLPGNDALDDEVFGGFGGGFGKKKSFLMR